MISPRIRSSQRGRSAGSTRARQTRSLVESIVAVRATVINVYTAPLSGNMLRRSCDGNGQVVDLLESVDTVDGSGLRRVVRFEAFGAIAAPLFGAVERLIGSFDDLLPGEASGILPGRDLGETHGHRDVSGGR